MVDTIATIFRDYSIDGDPGSPPHKPDKAKIREWGALVDYLVQSGRLARQDTSAEGGQIQFDRAFDAAVAFTFDCYGSGSSPGLRLFNGSAVGVQLTWGATSWSAFSDETLKQDLKPIVDGLEKVKTLRSVTGRYVFDEDKTSRAFLIAQDVQKVLPEAVKKDADGKLLLCYDDIIPLLVAAVKELSAKVDALSNQT